MVGVMPPMGDSLVTKRFGPAGGGGRRRRRSGGGAALLLVVAWCFGANDAGGGAARGKPVIRELRVPAEAGVRDAATLWCRFQLGGGARLYSVKWYKDDQEFFRFMPDEAPPTQTFPVPFVKLDEAQSDRERVRLANLSLGSSGAYRCEVSLEAPTFHTDHKSAVMQVLALPRGPPSIAGLQSAYAPGELVATNCSADASHPPATLAWFLNGAPAQQWLLDQRPTPMETTEEEGIAPNASAGGAPGLSGGVAASGAGLQSAWLALRVGAERRLFPGSPPRLLLRCVASLGRRSWEATASALLRSPPEAGQGQQRQRQQQQEEEQRLHSASRSQGRGDAPACARRPASVLVSCSLFLLLLWTQAGSTRLRGS